MSRYYNPEIARFISEDTYRGELNDPLSLNRYIYVNNNPQIYVDPNGEAPIPLITGAIGAIYGGGSQIVNNLIAGNNWYEGVSGSTIQGGITGFGFGLCGTLCGGAVGYLGNIANQSLESYLHTGAVNISQKDALVSGFTTLVAGQVFGVGGNQYEQSVLNNFVTHYATKGLLSGVAGDFTYQMLNNGITVNDKGKITGFDAINALSNYDSVQTFKTGIISMVVAPGATKTTQWAINTYGSQQVQTINKVKKPYSKSRPSYGKDQVETVYDNAKNSNGKVLDPKTGLELPWDKSLPRNGQWDMGHRPGQEYAPKHQQYIDGKITKQQFLDWYKNPNNYRPELPGSNRSNNKGVK